MPVQNDLSKQNIQDRYHGVNDPVAKKIMNTHATNMGLTPPEDQSIVSLTQLRQWRIRLIFFVDLYLPHKLARFSERDCHSHEGLTDITCHSTVTDQVCRSCGQNEVRRLALRWSGTY